MLAPGASFRVHSVFERALNLSDADGRLLGLVGPRGGNGPALVVLDSLPRGGFGRSWPAVGDVARVEPSGRLGLGQQVQVDLAAAVLWQHPAIAPRVGRGGLRRNLRHAAGLATAARGSDGLGPLLPHLDRILAGQHAPERLPLLSRVAWTALRELLQGWPAPASHAALGLVGLGPGQTPSGDDLLAGFLVASLHTRPAGDPATDAVRAFGRWLVTSAAARTTDLGLARLGYAAEGELDERSELALAALLGDDTHAVEATTRELLAYGHSSGLDTLVGLLVGVGSWELGLDDGWPTDRRGPRGTLA